MKVLLALAILLWAGSDALFTRNTHVVAHHNPLHRLSETPWISGKTHVYELTLNMSAGVPGMTGQVAKTLMHMYVNIRPESNNEYLMKIERVSVSQPRSSASSIDEDIPLVPARELERDLSKPIKFVYADGEVKSYTLGESENLQSRNIKRGILRHLEMKIHPSARHPESGENNKALYPIVYNTTENNELGTYDVYYGINVSPYPWFPYEDNVFNVSKTMDYEPYGYPSFHEHNNFASQGCPSLCQVGENPSENRYGAGCPGGYEPHQTPLKAGHVVHHNYRLLQGKMVIENMFSQETHVANMYDQDMVVYIESEYNLKEVSARSIEQPREQKTYTELNIVPSEEDLKNGHRGSFDDVSKEYKWIYGIFDKVSASEMVSIAEKLMDKISATLVEADIESPRGKDLTKDITRFQDVLSLLKNSHLETLFKKVVDVKSLRRASEKEKIIRQVFLDVLPICGTDEAIEFLTTLIKRNKLSIWEAKEVLEAIPSNIVEPTERNIKDLWAILELPHVTRHHVLHSAAHLTLANTLREACIVPLFTPDDDENEEDSSSRPTLWAKTPQTSKFNLRVFKRSSNDDDDDDSEDNDDIPIVRKSAKTPLSQEEEEPQCTRETVKRFLREISTKLRSTNKMQEKIVYLETVAHVGYKKSLEILKPYAYGLADDTSDLAPGDIDYLKTVTLYSMHNIAGLYPNETLAIVAPIYFNRTEVPRVRIAAFSVLIRSEPSLFVLQHVAQDSWNEPSEEVGSYVYSTLETFGNATTPCMKQTAYKIKLVISQTRTYDIGMHHSKTVIKTFFDDLRNFGIEKRFSVVFNNESFVPSTLYTALQYNVQALKDVFIQAAANIQGVTVEDLLQLVDKELLGFKPPRDIPSHAENDIFGTLHLLHRMPKELRVTLYKKVFYSSSYHFFDAESFREYITPFMLYIHDYFGAERSSFSGHFVKTFIPSSLHSLTYTSSGIPVDFRMRHPLVLSLKIESKRSHGSYYIRPSVYYATYHKKTILNIADKHAYGVYQEQKFSFTLPTEVSVSLDTDSNTLEFTYKLPEVPKRIFKHHSEAGTFVTELNMRALYEGDEHTETIKTIPTMFKRERVATALGLPNLYITHLTEDIEDQYIDVPRDLEDVVEIITDVIRNRGWRRKYIDATIVAPSSSASEVTFRISYNRTLDIQSERSSSNSREQQESQQSRGSWMSSRSKKNDDDDDNDNDNDYTGSDDSEDEHEILNRIWPQRQQSRRSQDEEPEEISPDQAEKIHEALSEKISKVAHELTFQIESKNSGEFAEFRVEYNRTLDRMLHMLKFWAEARSSENSTPQKMCLTHLMRYFGSPCEFNYDINKYSSQVVPFFHAISFGEECKPISESDVIAKGSFWKVPSQKIYPRNWFSETPNPETFVPETHDECLRDIREGKSQSPACKSAIIEESHLNRFYVRVEAKRDLPPTLQNITYKLERAIQHYYFSHVDVNKVDINNPPKTFQMSMNYIEKFTDKPVLDIYMMKPTENVIYHKIDPEYLEPLSSVYPLFDNYVHRATNNSLPPSCALMEKFIRTYDMETYPLPRDTCTYVLSTHCTEKKKFAVLAKKIGSDDTKKITVHVAEHKVVLKPSRSSGVYPIEYNDKNIQVTHKKPVLLDEESQLVVFLVPVYGHRENYILRLHADKAGIKVDYDGKNTKVQVSPVYKGELCGLCSEFDGEITREYRGPNQCWFFDHEDFAHSSIVDSNTCRVSSEPKHPVLCPSGEHSIPASHDFGPYSPSGSDSRSDSRYPNEHRNDDDDDNDEDNSYGRGSSRRSNEPIQRNVYVQRRDYTCFTTRPIPVCEDSQPEEEELKTMDFHCLPKNDKTTQRLIDESRNRVLSELRTKRADFSETVSIAKSCSPY